MLDFWGVMVVKQPLSKAWLFPVALGGLGESALNSHHVTLGSRVASQREFSDGQKLLRIGNSDEASEMKRACFMWPEEKKCQEELKVVPEKKWSFFKGTAWGMRD